MRVKIYQINAEKDENANASHHFLMLRNMAV